LGGIFENALKWKIDNSLSVVAWAEAGKIENTSPAVALAKEGRIENVRLRPWWIRVNLPGRYKQGELKMVKSSLLDLGK
jgi:hypothetical protein